MSTFAAQECLLSSLLWILGATLSFAQTAPPFTLEQLPVVGRPDSLATGDINGDGIPDVVGMDSTYPFENAPTPLLVYLGTPSGALLSSSIPVGVFHPRHSLQLADLDLDGDLDVALAHLVKITSPPPGSGPSLFVLGHQLAMSSVVGDGTGLFSSSAGTTSLAPLGPKSVSFLPQSLPIPYFDFGTPLLDPNGLQLTDLDSDGRPDALVSTFVASLSVNWSSLPGPSVVQVITGGFYLNEFLLGSQGHWSWTATKMTDAYSGSLSCDPAIQPNQCLSIVGYPGLSSTFAASTGADWNNDGMIDTVHSNGYFTRIYLNIGSTAHGVPIVTHSFPGALGSAAGDWNDDGFSDVATSREFGSRLILGTSMPSNPSTLDVAEPGRPTGLILADLNQDGRRDLAALNASIAMLSIRLTTPQGTFSSPLVVPLPAFGNTTRAVDADADGQVDIYTLPLVSQSLLRLRSNWPVTASTSSFGIGTLGCSGAHGVQALSVPTVGNSEFRIACTNVPTEALGLCIVSDAADIAGSDSLGVGLAFHVGFFTATYLNGFNVFSDTANNAQLADPIPNNPALIGQSRYYQFYWFWGGICQPSPYFLSASKGLQITIQ